MSIETYLWAAPKAELHVHLEGAIRPATLLAIAQQNSVKLPANNLEGLRRWFVYRDFNHFIDIYFAITQCLKTRDDYELIAYEFGAEMVRQNVHYAEVTFSPSTHHDLGIPHEVYFGGITRGRERARTELGVEIAWVFDIVRNIRPENNHRLSDYVTSVAIEGKTDGVVALGLGGAEIGHPPEPFAQYFERALDAGLHSAPHAGETVGPESVWGAIRALHAERIGHGVRSIEDPTLVDYLAEHGIPLEVCPTSNLRLGVYPDTTAHPFIHLREAGVNVTINSDDPPLFNTTLNDEVHLLHSTFGLDITTINEILLAGVRHSFLPDARKQEMEQQFRAEMDALQVREDV